jgi:hypothetical protein
MGGMDSRGRLHGKAAIITGGEGSIGMAPTGTGPPRSSSSSFR